MRYILAAVMLCMASTAYAHAPQTGEGPVIMLLTPSVCESLETILVQGMKYKVSEDEREKATLLAYFDGEDASEFAALFNLIPEPTEVEADTVVVYDHAQALNVYVVLFKDGCKVGSAPLDSVHYNRIMKSIGRDELKIIEPQGDDA